MDEPEAVGLSGVGQQGQELLQDGLQLQLVAQPPDAGELHVDPHRRADEPQLLGAHPGADLHVPAANEQRVQRPVPRPPVQLRLVGEVVDHQHLVKALQAQLLAGAHHLALDEGLHGAGLNT